jgi:hypothetical protein
MKSEEIKQAVRAGYAERVKESCGCGDGKKSNC